MVDKKLIKEVEGHIAWMLLEIYTSMWYSTKWRSCNIKIKENSSLMETLQDIKDSWKNEPILDITL